MVLLAAYQTLLSRLSGQADLVVGSPVANRNRTEIEGLIGFFANNLALRAELGDDPPFAVLLGRVREMALGAYTHQDLPFEKLVEELQPERSLTHSPLFQAVLVLQNAPFQPLELPGLTLEPAGARQGDAKFDLTLTLVENPAGLSVFWSYAAHLFDTATVERMAERFARLTAGLAAGSAGRLSELPLLAEEERLEALVGWSERLACPVRCLHEGFEAQAARSPESPAVCCAGEVWSYGEINRRANQLARYLRRHGVGPESLVGLCVERSPELVLGILGILKAGGAYVPLDPAYPRERLAFLLADSRVSVLLSQESLAAGLPESGARVILLDGEREAIGRERGSNLAPGAGPENLAYVIYTSGSTGLPKGALITHANVSRLFAATAERFGFGPGDVWTLFHSYAFDFSVWEIWGAWLHGGRLVVVPWEVSRSPAAFHELLLREEVTVLNQTPSAFRQLLPHLERGGDGALRFVIFGGEALEPAALGSWLDRDGRPPLAVNMYGITETTVHVTYRELGGADLDRPAAGGPIGRPLPDLWVALLDRHGQPVPAGAPGEMHVGGAGLMRGYLSRPELTAERLVPSPYGDEPGARLYRSGDLARSRPNGDLEFLGRSDQQVKIRGFRIEPGEIEAALAACPGVEGAVVEVRNDLPGGRGLAAYVAGRGLSAAGLRETLKSRLPEYMMPAGFAFLPALPLTAHGKVDRRALSRLELEAGSGAGLPAPPRTPAEELLAAIFAEVLERERVGAGEDFFALGGHSLLATRVASRVSAVFGVEMPLRALFEDPTVTSLARRIEGLLRGERTREAPPLVPVPRGGDLPLSFAQERLWFLDQLAPGSAAYNVPLALQLTGPLHRSALAAALAALVARHEALRTRFAAAAGLPVQVIGPAPAVQPALVDLGGLPAARREEQVAVLAAGEALRPFDLARGPLLRATLLRLETELHAVLFNLHHIVADGWSLGVLVRDLGALYGGFAAGLAAGLPELPVQYADFAVWQRSWLNGEALAEQLAWWRRRLAGAPAVLDLPLDRPRPAVQSLRGASVPARLPADLSRALEALGRSRGATPFMLLLAGFQALLARLAGEEDVVVGSPVANRTRVETEGLIGFFANTLALRGEPLGELPFDEWLARVREMALGAYAHQDLPFERLVEELQPERSLAHSPLFQVMLVLQNAAAAPPRIPGLALETATSGQATAKFDLTLSLVEGAWGLAGNLEYASDLFDAVTVQRLLSQFQTWLAGAVAAPGTRLSELPLLAAAERHQLVIEWNADAELSSPDLCVHRRVERQAERSPEAIAVAFAGETLTYRELERRAGRVARLLRRQAPEGGFLAGLCAERSLDMVVALLGILKAGGACVPLDPNYPAERIAFMLEDSRAAVLLTQEAVRDRLPATGARVVVLDRDLAGLDPEAEEPPVAVRPEDPAYVIYTSGSTGRPKGVAVTHCTLANLLLWQEERAGLGGPAATLQYASLSFDVSFQEIFATWSRGGTLHLVDEETRRDAPALLALLARAGIERLYLPFVALRLLAEAAEAGSGGAPWLRDVITAGEQLQVTPAVRRWLAGMPGCRLHNQYGPSESHVVTAAILSRDPDSWPDLPSIGRPVAGARIHLLDRGLHPVPVGVAGELCIAGITFGTGYVSRPELTAGKFVPDPWSRHPGGRLYRTGDLARYRVGGEIEYLGRADQQVKIRGFRVEPGEVEAALAAAAGVQAAVVAVREDLPGGRGLVAWVVPAEGAAPTAEGLREHLRARLPDYMVPTRFALRGELPLTPSGKVDRRALSRSASAWTAREATVAPRTPTEELLAGIFAEVLRTEGVGAAADFFQLGGHSLLATQVVSRIRRTFGVELPLRDLFESPTVAGLAVKIDRRLAQGAGS